jgi:hypothetical protein
MLNSLGIAYQRLLAYATASYLTALPNVPISLSKYEDLWS